MTAEHPPAPLRLTVGPPDAGKRLDRWLAGHAGSRSQAQRLLDADRVRVDGTVRPKSHLVSAGETVTVEWGLGASSAEASESAETAPHRVMVEDEHLIVIDKPAGVVVHPGRGHTSGTLAQALASRAAGGGNAYRAGIVHRLDRDTSGLLVVAKGEEVHRRLKALLAGRQVTREYLALVAGRPEVTSGTIDAPIGRHPSNRLRMAIEGDRAREARTHFLVERTFAGATLLRVTLDTGRTHQIRVHLAAIGLPVAGDPVYGMSGSFGLGRQFLHAARLAFPHPVTETAVDVGSPLPADLTAALRRLEHNG